MLSSFILFQSLLFLFFIVILFYVVGWLITRARLKPGAEEVGETFFYIFKGLLFCVSLFAIWQTKGHTILLLVPFVFAILISKRNGNPTPVKANPRSLKQYILFIGVALVIYWLFYLQAFVSLDGNQLRYAAGDNSFYARLAAYLNTIGKENSSVDYLYPERFNVAPYHYWDIWLVALAAKATGLNTHFALILITYPLTSALFAFGVYQFSLFFFEKRKYAFIVAILIGLYSGFKIFFPNSLVQTEASALSVTAYPKVLFISCLLIYSLIAIKQRKWNELIVVTVCFGIAFINIIPSFFLGLILLFTVIIFIKKNISLSYLVPSILISAVYLLYFYYYYKGSSFQLNQERNYDFNFLKTSLHIILGGALQFCVLLPYILLVLIIFLFNRNTFPFSKIRISLYYLSSIPVMGLLCWAALWQTTNEAVQFFQNVLVPCSAVFIAFSFLIAFHQKGPYAKLIGSVLFVSTILVNYKFTFQVEQVSTEEYMTVNAFVKKHGEGYFSFIKGKEEYKTIFSKNTVLTRPIQWMAYRNQQYQNFSLDAPFIKIDSSSSYSGVEKSLLENAPFSFYIKSRPYFTNRDSLQLSFIKDNGIKYLTASPSAIIPKILVSHFTDSIKLNNNWKVYAILF